MTVYLIQAGDGGPVKIGFTDGPVEKRLRSLQVGSSVKLRILRRMVGGIAEETHLHRMFGALRLEGEWFSFSAEMMAPDLLPDEPPPDLIERDSRHLASQEVPNCVPRRPDPYPHIPLLSSSREVSWARVSDSHGDLDGARHALRRAGCDTFAGEWFYHDVDPSQAKRPLMVCRTRSSGLLNALKCCRPHGTLTIRSRAEISESDADQIYASLYRRSVALRVLDELDNGK